MAEIRLLATDLDGTLIGSTDDFHLFEDFAEKVNDLRLQSNTQWVACTGRRLRSFLKFFRPISAMGVLPEYVIIRHAYILKLTRWGYRPRIRWNLHILWHLWIGTAHLRHSLKEWHAQLTGMCTGVTTVSRRADRLCLRFDRDEDAVAAESLLLKRATSQGHICVTRHQRDVEVRLVPFTKGIALGSLAENLGISREEILAIGNGHNDISMLSGEVATRVGCPSNAEVDVMQVVHDAGGHISGKRVLAGVLDVMDAFKAGSPSSTLPEWWQTRSDAHRRRAMRKAIQKPKGQHHHRHRYGRIILLAFVAYGVLLAFANFNLLPKSHLIMKPLELIIQLVECLLPR